jgi:hypothetical protein
MITKTGKNLSILIVAETGKDWETFGTWYSIFKNLPDATVAIASLRNKETPFMLFQWAKRLGIPLFHFNPIYNDLYNDILVGVQHAHQQKLVEKNILTIVPLTMAIDVLDQKTLDIFNLKEDVLLNLGTETQWFLRHSDVNAILNEEIEPHKYTFCVEANETKTLSPLVNYQKGCGKWIDTLKGCPFSNAAGLASTEMTINENRIIELWKKMCNLYSATA